MEETKYLNLVCTIVHLLFPMPFFFYFPYIKTLIYIDKRHSTNQNYVHLPFQKLPKNLQKLPDLLLQLSFNCFKA